MKKLALIDVDNVIANTDVHLKKRLARFGYLPAYSWNNPANSDSCNELMSLIKGNVKFWLEIPIIHVGMALVNEFLIADYELHFVTGIPTNLGESVLNAKVEWIRNNVYPHAIIHITNDRSRFNADILIDDSADFAVDWLNKQKHREFPIVLMPTYSYNKHLNDSDQIIQYHDYASMKKAVSKAIEVNNHVR